jgi:hypothetical protein
MGGLGEGRKQSRVAKEIVAVNISLHRGAIGDLVFFWEQRGAIGVEMLLHTQESPTSIGLNVSDTLHIP